MEHGIQGKTHRPHKERLKKPIKTLLEKLRCYLITDSSLFPSESSFLNAIEVSLRAGIRAIQLREKKITPLRLYELSLKIREITSRFNALFFINDRADIAMSVNADGVHLPASSMPVKAARELIGDNMLIGRSTHSLKEALLAREDGADFITFGPVFPTPSKLKYGRPKGIKELQKVCNVLEGFPVIALGGINLNTIDRALETDIDGVSMISAIWLSNDIEKNTKKILERITLKKKAPHRGL